MKSLAAVLALFLLTAAAIAAEQPESLPQHPLAGQGAGGARGPSLLPALREAGLPPAAAHRPAPENPPPRRWSAEIPASAVEVHSRDTSIDDGPLSGGLPSGAASTTGTHTGFTTFGEIDVAGSTNGAYIVAYDSYLSVYNMNGTVAQRTDPGAFWCAGASPLPTCSLSGFAGDQRVKYDAGAGRWIVTALWVFSSSRVATNVIAVSRGSDPTQGWYRYQFPACGAFDDWDGSDQPHTGFNDQWIVVTSACSAQNGVNGAGLAVFDKSALYAGSPLALNGNWFEFVDPYSGGPYSGVAGANGTRDHPVSTYAPTANHREYLAVAVITPAGRAAVLYSRVEGAVRSPVFYSAAEVVVTGFQATGPPPVDAPGCTACMVSYSNGWIHSAGVWAFQDGAPYILSTMVLGDPRFTNSTQIVSVARNAETGDAIALQAAGATNGSGPMASEIAMPLVRSGSADRALVVYDRSRSDFYPGVMDIWWDVDTNTVIYVTVLKAGVLTPTGFNQHRWVDFIDGMAPIPDSSQLVAAASAAVPSPNDPQHATHWSVITP